MSMCIPWVSLVYGWLCSNKSAEYSKSERKLHVDMILCMLSVFEMIVNVSGIRAQTICDSGWTQQKECQVC